MGFPVHLVIDRKAVAIACGSHHTLAILSGPHHLPCPPAAAGSGEWRPSLQAADAPCPSADGSVLGWGNNATGQCGLPTTQPDPEDPDGEATGLKERGFRSQARTRAAYELRHRWMRRPGSWGTRAGHGGSPCSALLPAWDRLAPGFIGLGAKPGPYDPLWPRHPPLAEEPSAAVHVPCLTSAGSAAGPHVERTVLHVPHLVPELAKFDLVAVSAGQDHSAGLTRDGRVVTWGSGKNGRLGRGKGVDKSTFYPPGKSTDAGRRTC